MYIIFYFRLDKSLLKVAKFYEEHWANYDIIPIILCATDDKKDKLKLHFTNTFTLKEYVEGFWIKALNLFNSLHNGHYFSYLHNIEVWVIMQIY